jgi:hypothetical protein
LSSQLEVFDRAVPRLKDARDVLEHFEEEYVLGRGKHQQPDIKHWEREVSQALAEAWTVDFTFRDLDSRAGLTIAVGPIEIDLEVGLSAARALIGAMWEAGNEQGMEATRPKPPRARRSPSEGQTRPNAD